MNTPSGFVTATIAAQKTTIWSQPMPVMLISPKNDSSEFFRPKQRVNQVRAEQQREQRADSVVEGHGLLLQMVEGLHVRPGQRKKCGSDRHEQDIFHVNPCVSCRNG